MAENTSHCRLLLYLAIYLLTVQCSIQQSCSGPTAAVGNRCRYNGAEICCIGQASCDPISGLCECPIGKAGPICEQLCPLNTDDNACETNCANNDCITQHSFHRCRQQTGQLCICNPQFEGHNCENCIIGFKGAYCNIACPVASDGVSCETDCTRNQCSHFDSCIQSPDVCLCKTGAKGPNCELACPISNTQSCEISCIDNLCHISSTCRETATGCQCLPGHHGGTCSGTCLTPGWTGLDCTVACPLASDSQTCEMDCTNNPCHNSNTCQQTAAGCHCLPGYRGEYCQLCSPIEVDGECKQYCESNGIPCQSGGFCDILSRKCDCPDGLTGDTCQFCDDSYQLGCSQFCESDCYGRNHVCNTRTETCECSTGFIGSDCQTCDPAIHPGRCTDFCPGGCDNNILCNVATRECICKQGHSGSSCEYCHPTQESGQCREYCQYKGYACDPSSSCLTTTGDCICPKGQSGSTCNYCASNAHFLECKNFCSSGCYGIYQTCNTRTSQCECLAGFTGSDCDMCDPATHPSQCLNFCSHVCSTGTYCDTNTNECTCRDGYLGDRCLFCRPSLNPQRCTQDCSYTCQKGDCYLPTKECNCFTGFMGKDCSLCIPQEESNHCRSYCDVECQNGGLCDVYDGTCYCVDTFYSGRDCSLCNETLEDGPCLRHCGKDCLNGGLCNTSSLACECLPGYELGDCSWCNPREESNRCLQHCGVECLNNGHCDTLTDICICLENYTGSDCGLCIPHLHRNKCRNYCDVECKNNATCDTRSGFCICPPGFNGTDCSQTCTECRVPLCDMSSGKCENTTQAPTFSMGNSGNTKDPQEVKMLDSRTLLIGVGSAVGAILVLIIIVLVVSVCHKDKKERSAAVQGANEHIPMMDGHGNGQQQKCDNSYSQANTLMSNRPLSVGQDDAYDPVCDDEPMATESDDLYAYASTEKVLNWRGDSTAVSDNSTITYAYASAEQTIPENIHQGTMHGKHTLPVEVDAEYNVVKVGSPPSAQVGSGSNLSAKSNRFNAYEDPADILPPEKPTHAGRSIPPYAQVNKGKKGFITLSEDKPVGDGEQGPASPRYTVVEPDFSASDSEDMMQADGQPGGTCPLYAEASDSASSLYEEANNSPSKARMPPYAKVNKNKTNGAKSKSNVNRDVYDKLQRPLTTFTIDDNDSAEDCAGEYSHLIATPQVKQGYSKLDYGSPPSNSSKPQFKSNNAYAELQVQPEN